MKRLSIATIFLITFMLLQSSIKTVSAQTPTPAWTYPIDVTGGVTLNWRAMGYMLCDRYQNLHIFWADEAVGGPAIYYRNDVPGRLSPPTDIISLSQGQIFSLEGATASDSDFIHLVWTNAVAVANLYYARGSVITADNAQTWSKPLLLDSNVTNGSIKVDPQGIVHIVYAATDTSNALNYDVIHIYSTDDGTTWSKPQIIYSRAFPKPSIVRTEIAIDEMGRIHLGLTIRSQDYGLYSEVGYMRSEDGGKTWTDYLKMEDTGKTFQGVDMMSPYAFGNDEIHLTWHDPGRTHIFSKDGGKTWSKPEEMYHLGGAFGGYNELVKDASGTVRVILAVSNEVVTLPWDGTHWGLPEVIDSRDIDPHGQHIVMCRGNKLNVIYYDRTGDTTVWYAEREYTAVPTIARVFMPTPTLTPTPIPTITITPGSTGTATSIPTLNPTLNSPDNPTGASKLTTLINSSPLTPIGVGLIPAILILGIAILIKKLVRR